MPKLFIKWGKKPNIARLTAVQKTALKEKLHNKAKSSNGFLVTLTLPEYYWLKENLGNGRMDVMMRYSGTDTIWVAIGTDEEALQRAKQEVRP